MFGQNLCVYAENRACAQKIVHARMIFCVQGVILPFIYNLVYKRLTVALEFELFCFLRRGCRFGLFADDVAVAGADHEIGAIDAHLDVFALSGLSG